MARKNISDIQVLRAAAEFHSDRRSAFDLIRSGLVSPGPRKPFITETLAAQTGQPIKVCERAMERAFHRGLIDYDVSLRTAWPTDSGKALLDNKTA